MASTTFTPGSVVRSTWLNDVNGATYLGTGVFTPDGVGAVARTMQAKLRERKSISDFPDLATAFSALGGAEGTGYNTPTVVLDLLNTTVVLANRTYVPTNIILVNGTITSTTHSLVFRNPYLANTGLRGYTEYWAYMTGGAELVTFNCRTIINDYIGAAFDFCTFTGQYGALVFVNSNSLWTEYNTFNRCTFSSNATDSCAVLFDGNASGTSTYSTGTGSGTDSFGYTNFVACKLDAAASYSGIKIVDGGLPYNGTYDFRGYIRGNTGAFLYVSNGGFNYNRINFHVETFGAAGNLVQVEASQQFKFNTGAIHSASPQATFTHATNADVAGNMVSVIGSVLQDSAGAGFFLGDQIPSWITTHLLKRIPISGYPIPTVAATNAGIPTFSVYLSTTNQTITSNVTTKLTLNGENFDTHGYFDSTTNYRFTPKISGYYQLNAATRLTTTSARGCTLSVYKNGSLLVSASGNDGSGAATPVVGASIGTVVYLNGTTDYIEMYIYCFDNSGAPVVQAGAAATWLNGILVSRV